MTIRFRSLAFGFTLLAAVSLRAAPVVVDANESFRLRVLDGGQTTASLVPLPGEAAALAAGNLLGKPGSMALIQLGGPDAGQVITFLDATSGSEINGIVRVSEHGGSEFWGYRWFNGDLTRIEASALRSLHLSGSSAPPNDTTVATISSSGSLRFVGSTHEVGEVAWESVYFAADGGVVYQALETLHGSTDLDAFLVVAPPSTNEVYTLGATAAPDGGHPVGYGRFDRLDAGLKIIGNGPTYGQAYTSSGVTYVLTGQSSGDISVAEFTPTGIIDRGSFRVDAGIPFCSPGQCVAELHVMREAFPGYPNGALLFPSLGDNSVPHVAVLVGWDRVASALGLTTDATAVSAGKLLTPDGGDSSGGSGSGGSGGSGPVSIPLGPGVAVSRGSGCTMVSPSGSSGPAMFAPAILALLVLLAKRRSGR